MSGLSGFAILVAVLSQSVRPEDVLDGSFVMADIGVGQYLRTWLPLAVGVGIALGFPPFGRVLSDDEVNLLERAEIGRMKSINVDDFDPAELRPEVVSTSSQERAA